MLLSADFSSFRGKEIGNEKLIGILDLQQLSYKNVDPRGLITGFQFLQVSISTKVLKANICTVKSLVNVKKCFKKKQNLLNLPCFFE